MAHFPDIENLLKNFAIDGVIQSLEVHKSGHINDTYISEWSTDNGIKKFVHQRINENVFKDVPLVMSNMEKITAHIKNKISAAGRSDVEATLEIIPLRSGATFINDSKGNSWRTFSFIENTVGYNVCQDLKLAFESAQILGRFQSYLIDFDASQIKESIPQFISSPHRLNQLRQAISADSQDRVRTAQKQIDFAISMEPEAGIFEDGLRDGSIPTRVIHGDMKLNNVLFSKADGHAFALVDMDVCMPGYSLYDFGDLVRNTSVPCKEDETDLSKVYFDKNYFKVLVEGYFSQAKNFLNKKEIALVSFAPRLLALTLGVRFLTDYLNGDVYFKTNHASHNLERSITQFKIVECLKQAEPEMGEIVRGAVV